MIFSSLMIVDFFRRFTVDVISCTYKYQNDIIILVSQTQENH